MSGDGVRPLRAGRWRESGGRVTLLVPRFGRGQLGRALERWLRPHPVQVHLDALGSFVWNRLDGSRSVEDLAREMEEAFGGDAASARERLEIFLTRLRRGRFVAWGNDGPTGRQGEEPD